MFKNVIIQYHILNLPTSSIMQNFITDSVVTSFINYLLLLRSQFQVYVNQIIQNAIFEY